MAKGACAVELLPDKKSQLRNAHSVNQPDRPKISSPDAALQKPVFPDLWVIGIHAYIGFAVFSVLAAGLAPLLRRLWPPLAWVGALLPALLFLHFMITLAHNFLARWRWSRSLPRRLWPTEARKMVVAKPENFVVFVKSYRGFDVDPIAPSIVIKELASGESMAVYPASSTLWEKLGTSGVLIVLC